MADPDHSASEEFAILTSNFVNSSPDNEHFICEQN